MYKVFLKYPESLRPAFPRLKEKLEDPDPGIRKNHCLLICDSSFVTLPGLVCEYSTTHRIAVAQIKASFRAFIWLYGM